MAQSPLTPNQQDGAERDEDVCDVEERKRPEHEEIRHSAVAEAIDDIGGPSAEDHADADAAEEMGQPQAAEEHQNAKRQADEDGLEDGGERNAEGDAGIRGVVQPDPWADDGQGGMEKRIGERLRGHAEEKAGACDHQPRAHASKYTPPVLRRMDLFLVGITVGLTFFGLAMIASVSVFESHQITQKLTDLGLREGPGNSFYLLRSFSHAVIGLAVMGIMALIPYHLWKRAAKLFFLLTLLLILALFVPGIGNEYGTARSWLIIGGFSLQPSELLKLSLIFYLSLWLQKREQLIGTFHDGFLPFASLLLLSTIPIALQPDLGSFLILSAIAGILFFIAGGNVLHLLLGGGIAGVIGLPFILQEEYVRNRFEAFLSPHSPTMGETIGFQIQQALIAIGSGGMFGLGYGKSIQKFGYLPEVQADMIFSAMAEELGFVRLLIIFALYALFVWRGLRIARFAPDRFGFLIATGITSWIASQTLLNFAVNVSLFPLTGLTLPFISYGGSSLVTSLAAVGILLNISMHSTEEMTPRALRQAVLP